MRHPFEGMPQTATARPSRRSALGRLLAATMAWLGLRGKATAEAKKPIPIEALLERGLAGPPPPSLDLSQQQLDEAWRALAKYDLAAFQLLLSAKQTSAFLIERIERETAPPEATRLARWIKDLESNQFEVRQAATAELNKVALAAEPALQKALEGQPSLEMTRRIEAILSHSQGSLWQMALGLELLLQIGTPETLRILATLAGRPNSRLTTLATRATDLIRKLVYSYRKAEDDAKLRRNVLDLQDLQKPPRLGKGQLR